MRLEPAIVMSLIIGGFVFFFLLLPWLIVLSRALAVWRHDRGAGLVLSGVILLTAFFYAMFFAGFAALVFSRQPGQ